MSYLADFHQRTQPLYQLQKQLAKVRTHTLAMCLVYARFVWASQLLIGLLLHTYELYTSPPSTPQLLAAVPALHCTICLLCHALSLNPACSLDLIQSTALVHYVPYLAVLL